jgi:hypothetical protein
VIRHSYTTFEKMFSVISALQIVPTDHDTVLLTFGPFAWEFVEVRPNVFRRVDSDDMIAFSPGPGGKAAYVLDPLSLPNHTAYRLAWYEAPPMLFLIAGFGLLCFIVAIVSALRHWKADRAAEPAATRARRLAALLSAVHLLFLGFIGILALTLARNPFSEVPGSFKAGLVLPLLAIPLTLLVLWFAVQAWRAGWWTRYGRAQYTAVVLGSVAFLWLLNYVNLIGYKFG